MLAMDSERTVIAVEEDSAPLLPLASHSPEPAATPVPPPHAGAPSSGILPRARYSSSTGQLVAESTSAHCAHLARRKEQVKLSTMAHHLRMCEAHGRLAATMLEHPRFHWDSTEEYGVSYEVAQMQKRLVKVREWVEGCERDKKYQGRCRSRSRGRSGADSGASSAAAGAPAPLRARQPEG